VWALAYGSVRVWWAVAGAPSFGPLGTDLIAFTGWWASACAPQQRWSHWGCG
jgi:hypothetical protein